MFTIPFVPLICSVIVLWYCWKSSKFLNTNQIGLGVFLSLMGLVSFIVMAILYNNGYIIFEIGYIISLVDGLVFLIAGIILIINGILIEKKK